MKFRYIGIILPLLLAGCAIFGNGGGGNVSVPSPGIGQWVAFGGSENQVQGNSITFDCCQDRLMSGYYYTRLPQIPQVGQTLTLTYTLTGNNPVFAQVPASGGNSVTDTNPPTNSLLIWQAGDNLSCQGDFNFYRLFNRIGKTNLTLGTHTISVQLVGANWQGCYPGQTLTDARLQQALNNLTGIGFTFGGQSFDGHGIYLSSGSATFTINSFTTVQ